MTQLREYHTWSIASVRFGAVPDDVSPENRQQLTHDVNRALTLESLILASPEATTVSIPEDQHEQAVDEWLVAHPDCELPDSAIHIGIRRELMVQAVLDGIAARAVVPGLDEARAFFEEHGDRFRLPERRAVRHILITVNPEYPDNTEAEARIRVDRLALALEAGEDFAELAGRHSECPTAMQGGQVGTVPRGTLYPEVEGVAFELEAGEWGGPVRTELGWHLVQCDAVLPQENPDFDSVADRILEHLIQQARRSVQVTWLKALTTNPAA